MPHVQSAGHVRRRQLDAIGRLLRVAGLQEVAAGFPQGIPALLNRVRFKTLGEVHGGSQRESAPSGAPTGARLRRARTNYSFRVDYSAMGQRERAISFSTARVTASLTSVSTSVLI